jgi:hypothetical protein
MKVALHPTSEVGVKAGRILLGEPALDILGVLDRPVDGREPRLRRIDGLMGFDVAVTDDPELAIAADAIAVGIPLVVWVDADHLDATSATAPVMTGANLATGVARALAARERPGDEIVVAWTEPGKSLRRGEPVTFPDPVGARWGRVRARSGTTTEIVVPVPDEWAGVVVRTVVDGMTRILGIADAAEHLEALSLAAGAITLGDAALPAGSMRPEDVADEYLLAALRAGLDIASFTKA